MPGNGLPRWMAEALEAENQEAFRSAIGAGSGGGGNAFGVVAVSGQSNVAADAEGDTLTLAAGANIALTTNASTDTVTIAATGLAAASHTHDDRYYTDGEVDTLLAAKAAASHSHAQSDVTGLVSALAGKADAVHSHVISDTSGLQTALDGKAATSHSHAISDVTGLQTALDGKANVGASGSPYVYVAGGADTAINSVTDVTLVTRDVTGVGTTDKLTVEGEFTILNNSTATRVYVITLDFDGLFDVEFTTGALAFSTTLMHPFFLRATLDIRSASLAYAVFTCEGQLAAGVASGGDTTMAATHLRAMGWGTTTSNASGTCTVTLRIRSANATATQTARLHRFAIQKLTPT